MIYRPLLYLWLFFSLTMVSGQKITGSITFEDNPVAHANILVKDPSGENTIIQYTYSNADGTYSILLKTPLDSVLLEVSSLQFEHEVYRLKNPPKQEGEQQVINFSLREKITGLEEVVVEAERIPVRIKKDTVVYNPEAFKNGSEKVVEDLLKRLPGIEVGNNGLIKYKGKYISKLLLEGDDLFDANYSVGTKNIDVEMVEAVEAIENYLDNPLLKGVKHTDDVALNLKLKKGKTDFSGTVEIGTGYRDAYHLNGTVLGISQRLKTLVNIQYNTIGLNNSPYDFSASKLSIDAIKEEDYLASVLTRNGTLKRNLHLQQENINRLFYTTTNILIKTNEKLSVKTNLGYYNDNLSQDNFNTTLYNINSEPLRITTSERISKKPSLFNGNLEMDYKTGDRSLLEYDLKYNYSTIRTENQAVNNRDTLYNRLNTKPSYLKQNILFTNRINEKNALQFRSLYTRSDAPQDFIIRPGYDPETAQPDGITQNLQKSGFEKRHLNFSVTWINNSKIGQKQLEAGVNRITNRFDSALDITQANGQVVPAGDDFTNAIKYTITQPYFSIENHFRLGRWGFKPSVVLNYTDARITDAVRNTTSGINSFTVNPSVKVTYKVSDLSVLLATYSHNQKLPDEENTFQGYVFTSYRNLRNNDFSDRFQASNRVVLGYLYNDLFNLFRFNIFTAYESSHNSYFSAPFIEESLSYDTRFLLGEGYRNYSITGYVSKYLKGLKTTASFSTSLNLNTFKNVVNGSDLRDIENRSWNNQLFLKTGFKGKINFENNFSVSTTSFYSDGIRASVSSSLEDTFKTIYTFSGKLSCIFENHYYNFTRLKEDYYFMNLQLQYKYNDRISLSLEGNNMTGNKRVNFYEISDYYTSTASYNLMDAFYLISFNLKL